MISERIDPIKQLQKDRNKHHCVEFREIEQICGKAAVTRQFRSTFCIVKHVYILIFIQKKAKKKQTVRCRIIIINK